MDVGSAVQVITVVLTGGAAFGGVKVALNGTRERVKKLETELVDHKNDGSQKHTALIDRLARIETKLDDLRAK